MSTSARALHHALEVLLDAGFVVEDRSIEGLGDVVIAETMYALVMALIVEDAELTERVEDAQAALTRLAAVHPSPRSWDLYLVLVVGDDRQAADRVRERWEGDTRYARKLVATGNRDSIERALRPLLPLHPVPEVKLRDPLAAVRDHLTGAGVDPGLTDAVLTSFAVNGEVEIP